MAPDQIAYSYCAQFLAFDDLLRNVLRYASVGIDDVLVSRLRMAIAGRSDAAAYLHWIFDSHHLEIAPPPSKPPSVITVRAPKMIVTGAIKMLTDVSPAQADPAIIPVVPAAEAPAAVEPSIVRPEGD